MTETNTTPQTVALEMTGYLRRNASNVLTCTEDAPEWFGSVCHAAHGDMLPDNHRYEMINDVIDVIAEADDVEDLCFDSVIPVYTHRLTEWLASHSDRTTYVDDAAEDFGPHPDMFTALTLGYRTELLEVASIIMAKIEEIVSERLDAE